MVDLCMNHKISPADLVLEKVCWKKDGCGFSLLQLVFKNGITSPFFKTLGCDDENYITTLVKQDQPIRHIRMNMAENKYIESLEFLAKKENIQPEDILAKMKACRCGDEFIYDVPEGHNIVGLYGLVASNKYVQEG